MLLIGYRSFRVACFFKQKCSKTFFKFFNFGNYSYSSQMFLFGLIISQFSDIGNNQTRCFVIFLNLFLKKYLKTLLIITNHKKINLYMKMAPTNARKIFYAQKQIEKKKEKYRLLTFSSYSNIIYFNKSTV